MFMNLENVRYYIALICVVFGPSILYTGLITWPIRVVYDFEGRQLQVLYAVTYIVIVVLGFIFYRKRLRGVI
ncbi:hypothetical protein PSAKL28_51130 [Pseudomonas alkylphenolica]|uniref:Uncharacterized protein n=1 Tax=Pseudomonas alkylphenolica TaxID=237609 RepID=A0A077FGB5_9PSED|nr:hypothetical protein PSAKL28_51130 [Pseudomonas alkylphenolica]